MDKRAFLGLAAAAMLATTLLVAGQQAPPKIGLPVLTTSAGQSTDVTTLNIVLDEAGVPYDYCDVPTPEMVADGVGLGGRESGPGFHVESTTDQAKFPAGTPYKAVVFAIGASLKGMGASGLTLDSEEARLKKVIDYCKEHKIFVMAVHIGGERQRADDRRRRPLRRLYHRDQGQQQGRPVYQAGPVQEDPPDRDRLRARAGRYRQAGLPLRERSAWGLQREVLMARPDTAAGSGPTATARRGPAAAQARKRPFASLKWETPGTASGKGKNLSEAPR